MKYKLGKLPAKKDSRDLKFSKYAISSQLPSAPDSCDLSNGIVNWGMMKNDTVGDCTCASFGHLVELWTSNNKDTVIISDDDILSTYSAVSGYNPVDHSNDTGAVGSDVLNYVRQNGMGGHKIDAYLSIDTMNTEEAKSSIYLFGGLYIGVSLPSFIENEMNPGQTWI